MSAIIRKARSYERPAICSALPLEHHPRPALSRSPGSGSLSGEVSPQPGEGRWGAHRPRVRARRRRPGPPLVDVHPAAAAVDDAHRVAGADARARADRAGARGAACRRRAPRAIASRSHAAPSRAEVQEADPHAVARRRARPRRRSRASRHASKLKRPRVGPVAEHAVGLRRRRPARCPRRA